MKIISTVLCILALIATGSVAVAQAHMTVAPDFSSTVAAWSQTESARKTDPQVTAEAIRQASLYFRVKKYQRYRPHHRPHRHPKTAKSN